MSITHFGYRSHSSSVARANIARMCSVSVALAFRRPNHTQHRLNNTTHRKPVDAPQRRPTNVVNQPPIFSILPESGRLSRSQTSWTASSASLREPRIRYSSVVRRARLASNCSARNFFRTLSHFLFAFRHGHDEQSAADGTRACGIVARSPPEPMAAGPPNGKGTESCKHG